MAKAKAQGESLRGYFIELFRNNPDLVRGKSNAEVVQRWEKDHPGERFSKSHQNAMANAKTKVGKELGIRKRRKKRRGAAAAAGAPVAAGARPAGAPARAAGGHSLENLELAIDRCLSTARALEDRDEDMQTVARHLRAARNQLVWIIGK
jgi:hypothetical protein